MTKGEQARLTAWRLRILQQAASEQNVARTCRRFGVSRKSFYKGKRRQAEHGDAGLCDRPRTPQRSPRATAREVVSKILYLRQHYHFGPARIACVLAPVPSHRDCGGLGASYSHAAWDESIARESEASASRQTLAAL
jgi:transposase-like protein